MNCNSKNTTYLVLALAASFLEFLPILAPAQEVQLISVAAQKAILDRPGTATQGAAHADVTIIEYFDYNCPYCKKLVPALQELLQRDHKVAIVYKEWPILGEVSVYAAKAALAAQWQRKYLVAHDALMQGPHLAQVDQVDAILKSAGINVDTLRNDRTTHRAQIDAVLARNESEARALGLRGTPGIVIGRQLGPGIADLSDLVQGVEKSRHQK